MVIDNKCFDVDEARELISDPRYIIDEFIGAGAMACVYKVRERGTPNIYALKLLREQYRQREKFKEIFQREATHMRDLQYPNIVRFYKFVMEEHSAYILMDYVQGKPLTYYIQQARRTGEPMPIDKIVRIMAQVARAISYLHTEGFIHRDVKPGNILLVGEDEGAYLTDLGIAGAMDEPSLSGAGTPSYMPYEQQTQGDIDPTVDIYAFAIMMFELFTGNKPFIPDPGLSFNEARKEIVELHRKAAIPSISTQREDLPPEMDAFFEQALAKEPTERYMDILDFAQDIHEALLPRLPKDLQDFDNIQAQEIERSVEREVIEVPVAADQNRVIIGGVIAIFAIIALVFGAVLFNSSLSNATPTALVETPLESTDVTAAPEETEELPTPTAFLDNVPIYPLADDVDAIGYGETLNESIQYIASVSDGFVPLQFGADVNGFRVALSLRDAPTGSNQFGAAFRIQDDENYLIFTVDSASREWSLSEVEDGETRGLQTGVLELPTPTDLIVSAENDLIRIELGDLLIQQVYANWQSGSVALWIPTIDDESVAISSLEISLVGTDASVAEESGLGDLPEILTLQFLLEDIQALRATSDDNAVFDCSRFMDIYEHLENHLVIDGTSNFVSQARSISTVIFTTCQLERDNTAVEIRFSSYLDWDEALSELISDIEAAQQ